mgnify:FL=1
MLYLSIFWEFFKAGLFAIGGGMATVPFLFDICERTGWFTTNELANMIAVSESTPGPIGVNMATYVGFTTSGLLGGIIATIGLITPSVIIILIIAKLLAKMNEKPIVKTTFKYIRPAVIGLLLYAFSKVAVLAFFDKTHLLPIPTVAFFIILFGMLKWDKIHPVIWIILGAIFGLIVL